MHNLIFTEFIKLKRLKLLFLIPVAVAVPIVLGIAKWTRVRASYGQVIGMDYLFPFVEWQMTNGVLMMSVAFITIWIFVAEYRNNGIENMFSYPYARSNFMYAKLIVIFIITAAIVFAIFLLTILYGILSIAESMDYELIFYHLKVFMLIVLLVYSVVPICVTVCIVSKNYILPATLVVLIYVLNPQLAGIDCLRKLPWNVLFYIVQSVQTNLDPRFDLFRIQNYVPYILSSIITFILPMILNIVYFSKTQHSGSL